MRKYPKYKDSGVQWIREIPEDWITVGFTKIINIRHGFQFREGDFTDFGIKVIKITQLDREGYLNLSECSFIDENRLNEFSDIIINEEDVLMCLTGGTIGKIIKVGKVGEPLVQNYRVGHFSPLNEKIKNDYVFWFMNSDYLVNQIFYEIRTTGQPNIGLDDFGKMKVFLPPLPLQKQIVDFLDQKISIIDDLILKKQRKIELLKEHRTSIINQTVTKGLNPNVKMKDSGVEWIGEIPEHWLKSKLKYHGRFFSGFSFDSGDFQSEGEVRVIKISNIQNNGISWEDLSFLPTEYYDKHIEFRVIKGDLIFVLTRPIISTGIKICFYEEEHLTLLNQRNSVYRLNTDSIDKRFLYYIVRTFSFTEEFKQQLKETNQPNISTEQISNIRIYVPPIIEQFQIIIFLDQKTQEIDTQITFENKKIDLLKGFRQSLISEVVTGKIDVRQN
jgi:type I restriction enzyme S subunit